MKKKICVIFTGGTIGSDSDGKNLSLSGGSKKMLIDMYCRAYGNDIAFDELSPVNMLSENVQISDLEKLYDCIKSVNAREYDGIIITHGTDTLCFTANLLSQTTAGLNLPIVLVSALHPLTDARSHGVENFAGAVQFIEQAGLSGVYCSFKNDGEPVKIHLGSRMTYPDEVTGFYHSVAGAHLAHVENGKVVFNRSPLVPTAEEIKAKSEKPIPFALDTKVTHVTMRGLLDFSVYDFTHNKPRAVIAELSHSGTICTEGEELNFLKFADYCKEHNVEVVIAPVMSGAGVYASMKYLPENVYTAYDLSIEMTIAKVMLALGNGKRADAYFTGDTAFEKIRLSNV